VFNEGDAHQRKTTLQVQPAPVHATPWSRHESPRQQVLLAAQGCPALAQVAPGWQVPLTAPPGMLHDRPRQQSALAVQTPLWAWQAGVAAQAPPTQ
jgi:hypothetical protein